MSNVKYQVFISSTYEDLKDVRSEVVRAVLEMGHIPVGMEMFSAADEQQWDIIARTIDQSDYYVVIIGHRYGSMTQDGMSYTEKEYRYARAKGVPTLGFLIAPDVAWPPELVDTDSSTKAALEDFRNLVRERPVDFWQNAADLHGKCSIALMKAFTATPREGWVRGSSAASPELTAELTRLSSEAARLREELAEARAESAADDEARHRGIVRLLRGRNVTVHVKSKLNDDEWREGPNVTLFDLFTWLAPTILTEEELSALMVTVVVHAQKDDESALHVPTNWMQQMLADLASLDLVEPSSKRKSVHDKGEYWVLTDTGLEAYKYLRREKLERELAEATEQVANPPDQGQEQEQPASSDGS